MGMKIKGSVAPTIAAVKNAAAKITAAAVSEFNAGTDAMRDRAEQLVPVDRGNMETAIKITKPVSIIPGSKTSRTIYIDESVADVGQYARWLHEGVYRLGPKSQEKAETTGAPVGPKFLTRAVDSLLPVMKEKIADAMHGAVVKINVTKTGIK